VTSPGSAQTTMRALGDLFNESQRSCSTLFECSSTALDILTSVARAAGAYGSRLTGAGWGGCTVSLVPHDHVDAFISTLRKDYEPYKGMNEDELHHAVFATKPGSGASVYAIPTV